MEKQSKTNLTELDLTVDHYENFPVGSLLLPQKLRTPVKQIYHFSRLADDIADEGNIAASERILALSEYENSFKQHLQKQKTDNHLFLALSNTITKHKLPTALFFDLLAAFKQDIYKKRYQIFDEILQYCAKSANPVGRLMLHLFDQATTENLYLSDKVCTSLQLINFLQDIEWDYKNADRIYLPLEEFNKFGITEKQIGLGHPNYMWEQFMAFQIRRTETILEEGATIGSRVGGRFGLELKIIVEAAYRVLRKLKDINGDIFSNRPVVTKKDWLGIIWRAVIK